MKLHDNTILITGGSSGIGLELATQLYKNNTVIICGRSLKKLEAAKIRFPQIHIYQADISIHEERIKLSRWIHEYHPECNVLINNAAIVHKTDFNKDEQMVDKAMLEIETNLVAPIVLTKLLLPVLEKKDHSCVINITTGLVYAPKMAYPIYNATKAALHSFTQVIRHQLKQLPITITEVLMTVVDTPWHKGDAPAAAITPQKAVSEMLEKLEKGQTEIKIGKVKILHILSRLSPNLAIRILNRA